LLAAGNGALRHDPEKVETGFPRRSCRKNRPLTMRAGFGQWRDDFGFSEIRLTPR
jgi:hypothetical protein